jgi:hypothetical protein
MAAKQGPKCDFLPCRRYATLLLVHDEQYLWSCQYCADYDPAMTPDDEQRLTLDQVSDILKQFLKESK